MRNETRLPFLCTGATLLCALMLGCARAPEPSRIELVEPAAEPARADTGEAPDAEPGDVDAAAAPEPGSASADTADAPAAEPEQFVVYFGSFRDYLAASRYAESLRSAGLLQVNIERAKGGRGELLVTDAMDRAEADALAESLGGRVLTEDWARQNTEKLGSILQ